MPPAHAGIPADSQRGGARSTPPSPPGRTGHRADSPPPHPQVWHAARSGDAEAIGRLCSSGGADPSGYKDPPTLSTALHEAVLGGHARCASLLLSLGADASARDRAGNTPLHACAASASADGAGAVELAEALLAKGEAGTVAVANGAGATPLHLAASRGKLALVRLLVENGAFEGEQGGLCVGGVRAWGKGRVGCPASAKCVEV